jgi:ubiquinone/menaquinone biosynthesis C-methylase UbiE
MTTQTHMERQQAQFRRFMGWIKREGGVEGPTMLRTLMKPRQRERVDWLREHVTGRVLEVGCNWGYVLAYVGGDAGIDISPMNIELARVLSPDVPFQVGDATDLPFPSSSFDTVMVPEILEHLDFPVGVQIAVSEVCRVSRDQVLITVPDGTLDTEDATNFKHAWLLDDEALEQLLEMIRAHAVDAVVERRAGFVLIRATVGVSVDASRQQAVISA